MWIDGKQHGLDIGWHDNGQKWHDNGQKWWEQMWRDGKEHGMETVWYEDGKKQREVYYINHTLYAAIDWDDAGNMIEANFPIHSPIINPSVKSKKSHQSTGKLTGIKTTWWSNGQKGTEAMLKDGGWHGVDTSWWESGQKRAERYYIGNKEYARMVWDDEGIVTEVNFPRPSIINPTVKSKKNHINTQVS